MKTNKKTVIEFLNFHAITAFLNDDYLYYQLPFL